MAELVCDDGMIIRWGGEQNLRPLRIVLYMLALGWCFMGVAIIADVFMVAIEKITSKKRRRWNAEKQRYVTTVVWNDTVANLTLMALGSSAPEIMINILETFRDDFFNGPQGKSPLGPSTIVGSAAFNLFVIIAVCVAVIPNGETRAIQEVPVYLLTAFFSILAYTWLLVILLVRTPHAVEIWEAVLTFAFFPMLVGAAFYVDVTYGSADSDVATGVLAAEMTKEELSQMECQIRRDHGADLSEEMVARLLQVKAGEGGARRAKYRIAAIRSIVGGKRIRPASTNEPDSGGFSLGRLARQFTSDTVKVAKVAPEPKAEALGVVPGGATGRGQSADAAKRNVPHALFEFSEIKKAVLENAGFVSIEVHRLGDLGVPCLVDYKTRDGTAHSNSDYIKVQGTLEFRPGEVKHTIKVAIVDDFSYEENEDFYVDLSNARVTQDVGEEMQCSLYENTTITVVIVDDDMPGVIGFPEDEVHISEHVEDRFVPLVVQRSKGSTGKVSCRYRTENASALAGTDYEAQEGILEFQNQEMEHTIRIKILARGRYEQMECFRLILEGPITGGAKFDPESDGGLDSCILTCCIECEKVAKDRVDRLMNTLQTNWSKAKIGHSNWRDQFMCALMVNGGEEPEEGAEEKASVSDYLMHFLALPWKLLFAFVPPTDYCGGWLCFYVALGMIGFVTALISDLANLLGCALDICNAITAITFVALGTSLPDTFASKSAAIQDPHADASIVNVTGSNSVNVFLGLGVPWTLASLKWALTGRTAEWDKRYGNDEDIHIDIRTGHGLHIVKAGDLGFSVAVFTSAAVLCLLMLAGRRIAFAGELGGPTIPKYVSAVVFFSLWLVYVGLSSWKAMQGSC